ncbi:MAG: tetratricopeptide repeat protein [Sneathiellaceae bacterium]
MAITNFSAAIAAGKEHLDGGRADLAAFLFGQVLEADPTHPGAISGMASVMMHLGRTGEAADLLRIGIEAHPEDSDMRANRGALYLLMKDFDGALRCYDAMLEEAPGHAGHLLSRGSALMGLGRHDEAFASFEAAAAGAPAAAHLNMGMLHMVLNPTGGAARAEAHLRRALDADPRLHGAWTNIYALRAMAGDHEAAREAAEHALILAPHLMESHQNFAQSLLALGRRADARKVLEKLRNVNADFVPAELLLAQIAVDDDRPLAAIAHLHRASELKPQDPAIWANMAALLHLQGRVEQADAALDRALALDPGSTPARLHKGRIQLAGGRLADGFVNLAAMYDLPAIAAEAPYARLKGEEPEWDGAPLGPDLPQGGHLVLAPEPDDSLTILMLRFAAAARAQVGRITFLDFRAMAPLIERVPGIDAVVPVAPAADVPCDRIQRLGALPGLLPGCLDAPSAAVPYLSLPPRAERSWRARTAGTDAAAADRNRLTVGLIWRPHGHEAPGDERAIALKQAARLLQVPHIRFVSLQYGAAQAEIEGLAQPNLLAPLGQHIRGPVDLAAALASVDLAITVDCPAADMAGAMGLRCWVLLPHVAEWRWAERDGACLWYPTVTPFRQARPGDWDSAIAAAARSLERLADT